MLEKEKIKKRKKKKKKEKYLTLPPLLPTPPNK
jgi:hypothetical protein